MLKCHWNDLCWIWRERRKLWYMSKVVQEFSPKRFHSWKWTACWTPSKDWKGRTASIAGYKFFTNFKATYKAAWQYTTPHFHTFICNGKSSEGRQMVSACTVRRQQMYTAWHRTYFTLKLPEKGFSTLNHYRRWKVNTWSTSTSKLNIYAKKLLLYICYHQQQLTNFSDVFIGKGCRNAASCPNTYCESYSGPYLCVRLRTSPRSSV